MLYDTVLMTHNILRWVAFALLLWAISRAWSGLSSKREWNPTDKKAKLFSTIAMDIQLILGLVLYLGLSPMVQAARASMETAMKDREQRFFLVEHLAIMVLAVVVIHVGGVLIKRAQESNGKFKVMLVSYGFALILILSGIPWWRPMLRLWGA